MTRTAEQAAEALQEASSMLEAIGVQLYSRRVAPVVNWQVCRVRIAEALAALTAEAGEVVLADMSDAADVGGGLTLGDIRREIIGKAPAPVPPDREALARRLEEARENFRNEVGAYADLDALRDAIAFIRAPAQAEVEVMLARLHNGAHTLHHVMREDIDTGACGRLIEEAEALLRRLSPAVGAVTAQELRDWFVARSGASWAATISDIDKALAEIGSRPPAVGAGWRQP